MTSKNEYEVVGTITLQEDVTVGMVDDILTTAFEGGITYWCDRLELLSFGDAPETAYVSDVVSQGGSVRVHLPEGDGIFDLTLPKFLDGLQRWCEHRKMTPEAIYDNHDDTDADGVVQFALFGDWVYG